MSESGRIEGLENLFEYLHFFDVESALCAQEGVGGIGEGGDISHHDDMYDSTQDSVSGEESEERPLGNDEDMMDPDSEEDFEEKVAEGEEAEVAAAAEAVDDDVIFEELMDREDFADAQDAPVDDDEIEAGVPVGEGPVDDAAEPQTKTPLQMRKRLLRFISELASPLEPLMSSSSYPVN